MRPIKTLGFLIFMCVACLPMLVGAQAWALDTRTKYATHGFNYANMPDFETLYGIQRDVLVQRTNFSGWTDSANLPPAAWYDNLAAGYSNPHNLINIDIESWPVDTQVNRIATALKLATVYQEVKSRRPELQISFYAYPHVRDLYRAIAAHGSAEYLAWQAENNDFAVLWANIDWIAPSLYWFYSLAEDGPSALDNFDLYLTENISELHRCRTAFGHGQPIIPYISPWRAGADPAKPLDLSIWTTLITRIYQETDGWLLWTGQNTPTVWDDNAWWWINVKHYLPTVDRSLRNARTTRGVTPAPPPPRVTNRSIGTAVHLGTSISWSHLNGASVHSALVVSVSYQDNEVTTWTATYNGVSMTLVANNQVTSDGVAVFILTNPPVGTYTVAVSAGATTISDMQGFAMSLDTVNQSTPNRAPYTASALSGTFGQTVANSAQGDLIVSADVLVATKATVDNYQDRTTTADDVIGASARSGALSTKIATGANTPVSLTQTSSTWRGVAFAVIPYGGS